MTRSGRPQHGSRGQTTPPAGFEYHVVVGWMPELSVTGCGTIDARAAELIAFLCPGRGISRAARPHSCSLPIPARDYGVAQVPVGVAGLILALRAPARPGGRPLLQPTTHAGLGEESVRASAAAGSRSRRRRTTQRRPARREDGCRPRCGHVRLQVVGACGRARSRIGNSSSTLVLLQLRAEPRLGGRHSGGSAGRRCVGRGRQRACASGESSVDCSRT